MGGVLRATITFSIQSNVSHGEMFTRDDMKAALLMVKDTLEQQLRGIIYRSVDKDDEWEVVRKKITWHSLDLTGKLYDDLREPSRTGTVQEDREGEQ